MSIAENLRRFHPLHRLRRHRFFQLVARNFDPIVRWRVPMFGRPIYLRPLAHGAFALGAVAQEQSMYETTVAILRGIPAMPPMAFWDVGANIGYFTWLAADTRPDMEIVSFEPDFRNLQCLQRTSRRWKLPNHTIVESAVAESAGRAAFYVDSLSGATGTLEAAARPFNSQHYDAEVRRREVATISLDDFAATRAIPPALIKIDVEGAELRVVRGASEVIAKHKPVLLFESYEHGDELRSFLEAHQYRCHDADSRQRVSRDTINYLALVPERWPGIADVLLKLGYPV